MKTNGTFLDLHGIKHGQVFKTVDPPEESPPTP